LTIFYKPICSVVFKGGGACKAIATDSNFLGSENCTNLCKFFFMDEKNYHHKKPVRERDIKQQQNVYRGQQILTMSSVYVFRCESREFDMFEKYSFTSL